MTPAGAAPTPQTGNALIGLAGICARAAGSVALGAAAAARAASRPAAAAVRGGLRTPPGQLAGAEARSVLERLDAGGRQDMARIRAELDRALDSAVERFTTDAVSSQRTSRAIERLLDSEELWRLVDRIANSPEVLNAIASASVGLTGVVADEARRRTVTADEFAERVARRILRREPRDPARDVLEPAPGTRAALRP